VRGYVIGVLGNVVTGHHQRTTSGSVVITSRSLHPGQPRGPGAVAASRPAMRPNVPEARAAPARPRSEPHRTRGSRKGDRHLRPADGARRFLDLRSAVPPLGLSLRVRLHERGDYRGFRLARTLAP